MKTTGSVIQWVQERIRQLGTDRLTAALIGFAFFLTATVAALCADLWLWPDSDGSLSHPSAPQEPTPFVLASWLADPTSTPVLLATPATYPEAVRIRVPAIGIDRSIIEVPLTYDSQTNTWNQDYSQLFRDGREDLVGHYLGSASPGQPGNTVLVGHNYGYGVKGVFLRLGRLKAGQQVEVVNAAGQTFTYKVSEVMQIPWTTKDQQQLLSHQQYLSVGDAERLTLVTCGGSSWAPFPDRVYVVAYPVDQ
ncbi:MAG: class F sortase [Anaerolineae bacterium]|jgi:LPXTG-site transpeptidase (sortase) family protein